MWTIDIDDFLFTRMRGNIHLSSPSILSFKNQMKCVPVMLSQGMVAVITGGTGTLGRPMAEAMAAAGLFEFSLLLSLASLLRSYSPLHYQHCLLHASRLAKYQCLILFFPFVVLAPVGKY